MTNQEIIKNFLQQMANQDNRSTAFPFYYTIATEVKRPCPEDMGKDVEYYWNDETWKSKDEIRKYWEENEYSEDQVMAAKREICECFYNMEWEYKGMFLTETDAENHLRSNNYHYSHNAHTYVKHAWRAPELTEFLRALFEEYQIKKEG